MMINNAFTTTKGIVLTRFDFDSKKKDAASAFSSLDNPSLLQLFFSGNKKQQFRLFLSKDILLDKKMSCVPFHSLPITISS
jgi:hypothetical protein